MMKNLFFFFLAAALLVACKPATSEADGTETSEGEPTMTEKYTLTPFSSSPTYEDAEIKSMVFKDGTFAFNIGGTSYQLGAQTADAPQKMCANSEKGQHIHLIVDDAPYAAKYDAEFAYEIPDGEHYLLAFLSRSYHESIKSNTAYVAQKVSIEGNSIASGSIIETPMLFYSRPKGTYVGKANTDKVMLDFYMVNGALGENYTVKADINGEEHTLDTWQPYYIEGLPLGSNTITLTLMDADGKPAQVPLNPVSRTFELKADPVDEVEN